MVRVKIIKDYKRYRAGEVVSVSRNDAHAIIDGGYGLITKNMVSQDYKVTKGVTGRSK